MVTIYLIPSPPQYFIQIAISEPSTFAKMSRILHANSDWKKKKHLKIKAKINLKMFWKEENV